MKTTYEKFITNPAELINRTLDHKEEIIIEKDSLIIARLIPEYPADDVNTILDSVKLEIGYNLIGLATGDGTLLNQITNLRNKLAREWGLLTAPVRIVDNMDLKANEYKISIEGSLETAVSIDPDKLIVIAKTVDGSDLAGEEFIEPAFNMKCILIEPDKRTDMEANGFTVLTPEMIIITHLSELILNNADRVFGREETIRLLRLTKKKYPAEVAEFSKESKTDQLMKVLQYLLLKRIPVRNMRGILQVFNRVADNDYISEKFFDRIKKRIGIN